MKNLSELLHIAYNNIRPRKGKVLISQPFMADGCFKRSVVLLTEYSENGAIGLVLNKRLRVTMGELMKDFPVAEAPLSVGGPVSTDTLHYLHTFNNIPDAVEIVNGIYWGGNIDVVRKLLSMAVMKPDDIRFFAGYAGWNNGQLDDELKNDSWMIGDIRPALIINPSRDLWMDSVKALGEKYHLWTTLPEHPELN